MSHLTVQMGEAENIYLNRWFGIGNGIKPFLIFISKTVFVINKFANVCSQNRNFKSMKKNTDTWKMFH